MNKKKLIFLGLDVLVLVITIGVSLAVFNYARKGEEKNSVKVGAITMRYSEVSRKISIVDATPMEDEKGKVLNEDEEGNKLYFDFTIEASMSVKNPITYEVTLEKDKKTTLEDEYVRIYLEKKDSEDNYIEVLSPKNFVEIGEDDELGAKSTEMLLTTGEVTNNVIDYYRLRLWVDKDYTYSSSEKEFVATVNVYARNIEINKAERIELSTNSLTIQKGDTKKISATIKPDNTKNKNIIFESNNQEIVKVDSIGNITAIGVGSAIVTARTSDGDIKAECTITVVNYDAKGVELNTNNVTLSKGNTYQLTSIVTPTDASDTSVTYKSSSEGIATISSSGLITAVGIGETTITAETINGYTDTCKVIVTEPNVSEIRINGDDSVDVGSTIQLSTTITSDSLESSNVVWTSSDESKATISSTGKVTGIAPGTITITAYIKEYPNMKATKTIEVQYPEIKSITMSSDMKINIGNSTTFIIWTNPNEVRNQSEIKWTSSNPNVATIPESCNGSLSCTIYGLSDGITIITATTGDSTSVNSTLNVIKVNKVYLKDYIKILADKGDSTLFYDGTSDNNIRYYGSSNNVNNFVNFNCDSYGINCELWRIIGVFNSQSSAGIIENRIKLIKNESIGNFSYDTDNKKYWQDSSLKSYLNSEYLSNLNSTNLIENIKWNLGSVSHANYSNFTASEWYTIEKSGKGVTLVTTNQSVGTISASELGFASISSCRNIKLLPETYTSCYDTSKNWLTPNVNVSWTINSTELGSSIYIQYGGLGRCYGCNNWNANKFNVRPTVYLKSNVVVKQDGADGSYDKPYNIVLGS